MNIFDTVKESISSIIPFPAKINQISIAKVASYNEEPVVIKPHKFTFIYGLNGSGKTVISKYLASPEHNNFSSCEITFANPQKEPEIFVYNEDYIKETFYNNPKQRGIFTLGKDNADALIAIENAQNAINEIEVKRAPLTNALEELNTQKSNKTKEISDILWKDKTKYQSTSLKECMTGFMGDAAKFKDEILSINIDGFDNNTDIQSSLDELEKKMTNLNSGSLEKKDEYHILEYGMLNIEENIIWNEIITGASDSYLSDVIEQLDNENWIKDGITKYLDNSEVCPFCVRGLDTELKDKIKAHIDEAYQTKLNNLVNFKEQYTSYKNTIETAIDLYNQDDEYFKNNDSYNNAKKKLLDLIDGNLRFIDEKERMPNKQLTLLSSKNILEELNNTITAVNSKIQQYNKMVQDSSTAKIEIKTKFWQLLRLKESQRIDTFIAINDDLDSKIKTKSEELTKVDTKIKEQEEIVIDNTKNTKSIDEAIDWINDHLRWMGAEGFSIGKIKEGDLDFYKIIRKHDDDNNEAVFDNLSEGEKTLISFLYFMKSCTGTVNKSGAVNLRNRTLVIDDPISSMSFNFVFEIASMIKRELLMKEMPFSQVIILTHHLYFMHELFYQIKGNATDEFSQKDYALYRLVKRGNTKIEKMDRNDIKNNYESYWQIIKDSKNGANLGTVLPNAMRNILEHYFSFIHRQDNLKKAFEDLSKKNKDPSFEVFYRYINKESHSNDINLTDMKEIDVQKFIQYFEAIFEETGDKKHFENMIN